MSTRHHTTTHRGIALAIGGLLLLGAGAIAAGPTEIRIRRLKGPVEIGSGEPPVWRPAAQDDRLAPGEAIRTGRGARAELTLGTGTVRLYENSLVRIPADALGASGPEAVELRQGESLFDVIRGSLRDRFEVRTPEVVVSVKGTRFGVSLRDEQAAVSVYRGTVGVRGPETQPESEVLVHAGFAAISELERSWELVVIPDADPWNDWTRSQTLPALPDRTLGADAGEAALRQARELGREAVRAELIRRRSDRATETLPTSPEARKALRQRLHRARLQDRAIPETRPRAPHDVPPGTPPLDTVPERLGVAPHAPHPRLDPVSDARRLHRQRTVQRGVINAVVNQAMVDTPPPGSVSLPFTIHVIQSANRNSIAVSGADGLLGEYTQSELNRLVQDGDAAALGKLLPVLQHLHIDPILFATKLDSLI